METLGSSLLFFGVLICVLSTTEARRSDVFQKLVLTLEKSKYNKRLRPNFGGEALTVKISMYVGSLRSISEQTMDYKLELYFREYWRDERLAFNPLRFSNHSLLHLHESMVDYLWVPDTFFPNAIYSDNPSPGSITHRSLLRLDSNGDILYSRRISVTAECPMHLKLYPFDEQVCLLSIESYGYSTKDIVYEWKSEKSVSRSEDMQLPAFLVKEVLLSNRSIELATGVYSRLETCFVFKRSAAFYFVQLFVPATAIVITAWLSLYMERQSSFSDMVDVILAITFLYYSYNTVMPKVSYLKAMDIFLGTCFIFVFGALFKLAVMKSVNRMNLDDDVTDIPSDGIEEDEELLQLCPLEKKNIFKRTMVNCLGCVDSILRCVIRHHRVGILVSYPLMFLVFCGAFFVTIFSQKGGTQHCQF